MVVCGFILLVFEVDAQVILAVLGRGHTSGRELTLCGRRTPFPSDQCRPVPRRGVLDGIVSVELALY